MNSNTNTRPERIEGSRIAILNDDRGVTVYANKEGLTSLAPVLELKLLQASQRAPAFWARELEA